MDDKGMWNVFISLLSTLYSLLFLLSCATLPKTEQKTIFVSLFYNETKEYGLSEKLNMAMVDEIMKDGNFKIEDREKAELILSGRIVDYKKTPLAWTEKKEIIEFRIRMDIEFEVFYRNNSILKKRLTEAIIYSEDEEKERGGLLNRISRSICNELRRFIKGDK
ncbi:MAG: LptE family protein [bacterium]